MDGDSTRDEVSQLLTAEFAALGAEESILRTILLDGGRFAGYRYRCGEFYAQRPPTGGALEFYDAERRLLKRINLPSPGNEKAA